MSGNTYKIEIQENFITIDFRGNGWKFKSAGFNTEGLTQKDINDRLSEKIKDNKDDNWE